LSFRFFFFFVKYFQNLLVMWYHWYDMQIELDQGPAAYRIGTSTTDRPFALYNLIAK